MSSKQEKQQQPEKQQVKIAEASKKKLLPIFSKIKRKMLNKLQKTLKMAEGSKKQQEQPQEPQKPQKPQKPQQPQEPQEPEQPQQPEQEQQQQQPQQPQQPEQDQQPQQPEQDQQPQQPEQDQQPEQEQQPEQPQQPEQRQQPQQPQQRQQPEQEQEEQHQQEEDVILPDIGYYLFICREQLSRRKIEYIRLSKAKYQISDALLKKRVKNLRDWNMQELKSIKHQVVFKHQLRNQIMRLRWLQSLGIENANPNMESTEL